MNVNRALRDSAFGDAVDAPTVGQHFTGLTGGNAISGLWHAVFRRRWIVVAVLALCMLTALAISLLTTPIYRATTSMEILAEEVRIVDTAAADNASVAMTRPEYLETQYGLLRSASLATRVATDLNLGSVAGYGFAEGGSASDANEAIRSAADRVRGSVEIEPVDGSRLLNIRYFDPDRSLAIRVANAYARAFVASNLDRKTGTTDLTRELLEKRLLEAKGRLADSERVLATYARQAGIVNINVGNATENSNSGAGSLDASTLTQLNTALAEAINDRITAEQQSRFAREGSQGALGNSVINGLLARRADVASQITSKSELFRENYPVIRQLQSQLSEIDDAIARERQRVGRALGADLQAARGREADLRQQVSGLRDNLLDLNDRSVQYNVLAREVETNRQFYDALLQRFKEVDVEQNIGSANVTVVDPATSAIQVQPDTLFNILVAALIGSILGVLVALGIEFLDDSIKTRDDVTERLGLPMLGAIPQTGKEVSPIDAIRDSKTELSEAYFSAVTTLELATVHGAPKSILVTSSRPAEGKSVSAYALASAFARAGRNVLLIDGDMRKPTIELVGHDETGFSTLLAGSDDLAGAIRAEVAPHLSVMASGNIPPNPAELLSSDRTREVIARLTEMYDVTILDGPPVVGLADAPLLAAAVEGTVFVVESGGRRALVTGALARLRGTGSNIVGVILTKIENDFAGYGYGYGYDYGDYGGARHEDTRIKIGGAD